MHNTGFKRGFLEYIDLHFPATLSIVTCIRYNGTRNGIRACAVACRRHDWITVLAEGLRRKGEEQGCSRVEGHFLSESAAFHLLYAPVRPFSDAGLACTYIHTEYNTRQVCVAWYSSTNWKKARLPSNSPPRYPKQFSFIRQPLRFVNTKNTKTCRQNIWTPSRGPGHTNQVAGTSGLPPPSPLPTSQRNIDTVA